MRKSLYHKTSGQGVVLIGVYVPSPKKLNDSKSSNYTPRRPQILAASDSTTHIDTFNGEQHFALLLLLTVPADESFGLDQVLHRNFFLPNIGRSFAGGGAQLHDLRPCRQVHLARLSAFLAYSRNE